MVVLTNLCTEAPKSFAYSIPQIPPATRDASHTCRGALPVERGALGLARMRRICACMPCSPYRFPLFAVIRTSCQTAASLTQPVGSFTSSTVTSRPVQGSSEMS